MPHSIDRPPPSALYRRGFLHPFALVAAAALTGVGVAPSAEASRLKGSHHQAVKHHKAKHFSSQQTFRHRAFSARHSPRVHHSRGFVHRRDFSRQRGVHHRPFVQRSFGHPRFDHFDRRGLISVRHPGYGKSVVITPRRVIIRQNVHRGFIDKRVGRGHRVVRY